jgi:hypothetical protein
MARRLLRVRLARRAASRAIVLVAPLRPGLELSSSLVERGSMALAVLVGLLGLMAAG